MDPQRYVSTPTPHTVRCSERTRVVSVDLLRHAIKQHRQFEELEIILSDVVLWS